jgi:peptidoglycan-associated lipoprotein
VLGAGVVLLSAIDIKRFSMLNYLQRSMTRAMGAALVFLVVLSVAPSASAQVNYTMAADAEFARTGYFEAAQEYIKAYAKIKKDLEQKGRAAFMAGECYRLMMDPLGAREWYDKAVGLKYGDSAPELFLSYGDVMQSLQEYEKALTYYRRYQEKGGDNSIAAARIAAAEAGALAQDEPPSRYVVSNVLNLNSAGYDFGLAFAAKKGDEVIFASSRESSAGSGEDPITGESFMDLFRSSADKKGKWSVPEPLNNTVNTPFNEGTVTFDPKFKMMYFTRCVEDKKSAFACDVYRAPVMGTRLGPAELVPLINRDENDSSQVGHPAFNPDGSILVFASDMPGGQGGKDLWYITYDVREERWGTAKNMGPGINTKGDDMFPHFRYDGVFYFASNGHGGMGGLDIVRAVPKQGSPMEFGKVELLPYPLSSSSDDFGIVFYPEEDRGMFTSSRPGGKGKDDIYEFRMPDLKFTYRGTVYDQATGNPLMATVTITGSDGSSWEFVADGTGSVELLEGKVKAGVTYTVDVKKTGYIGTGDRFSTVGLTEDLDFAREYFLKEIILEQEYEMPLVLYPFDQATLLINKEVNSADSLNFLLDIMQRNPTFVIQLESHTDSRGNNQYNKELSQRRAQTCVDYLIGKGIDPRRLVAVGKGEDQLLISDAEIAKLKTEAEKDAAHQANRRTVFRILRFDFVPTK